MDRPPLAFQEELKHLLDVDVACHFQPFLVALPRRLARLAINACVVTDVEPGHQATIELIQREDLAGTYFPFELSLGRSVTKLQIENCFAEGFLLSALV